MIAKMSFKELAKRFARETSTGRFIPQLDGLRFIAITMVVLFHLNGYVASYSPIAFSRPPDQDVLSRLLVHGHYGVQFFFIISGFILALPFASHHIHQTPKIDLSAYYVRRLTRLEPPYLLSLILLCALAVLLKGRELSTLLPHLAAGLVYLHTVVYGTANPVNAVAWSLEIEVQFYLIVPLLTKLFAIRGQLRRRSAIVFWVSPQSFCKGYSSMRGTGGCSCQFSAFCNSFSSDSCWPTFTCVSGAMTPITIGAGMFLR